MNDTSGRVVLSLNVIATYAAASLLGFPTFPAWMAVSWTLINVMVCAQVVTILMTTRKKGK